MPGVNEGTAERLPLRTLLDPKRGKTTKISTKREERGSGFCLEESNQVSVVALEYPTDRCVPPSLTRSGAL